MSTLRRYGVLLLAALPAHAVSPETAPDVAPDLTMVSLEVRDRDRQSLITPTAGRQTIVYVEIRNSSSENAPDAGLTCRYAAGVQTIRTGALNANTNKRLTVTFPATSQTGPMRMQCEVDENNVLVESNETNNAKYVDFTIEPDRATDFRIELRNFKPWTMDTHRAVSFDVVNITPRGGASPVPAGLIARLRWQINCTVMQAPFLRIRSHGDMRYYPGDNLPAAGATQRASLWVQGFNTSTPPASSFPKELDLACKVTTGAFLPNLSGGRRI
jgi:hypothetical protein